MPSRQEDFHSVKLCPNIMIEDIQFLHQRIQEIHPNPYIYVSKDAYDNALKLTLSMVSKELTPYQFSLCVAQFLHGIQDSHTNINPRDLVFLKHSKSYLFPFSVRRIDDKFYLQKSVQNEIPLGVEILSLNHLHVDSIFKVAQQFSFMEGESIEARNEVASKMMGMIFNLMNNKYDVECKYKTLQGDTVKKTLKPITVKAFKKLKNWYAEEKMYHFFDTQNRGILVVPTFEPRSLKVYKRELDAFFANVRANNCKEVIIDLRDNRGGLIRAQEYLISFFNTAQKNHPINYLYKRSKFDRFSLLPFYQKKQFVRRAKRVYPKGIISQEYDFYKKEFGELDTILYDYIPRNRLEYSYNGNTTLIINGLSMSASAMFAAWFKENEKGKIIGTPCMGTMSGTFGNSATIYLKNTGFPVMISSLKFTPQSQSEIQKTGILPDVLIDLKLEELIQKEDPIFKFLNIQPQSAKVR